MEGVPRRGSGSAWSCNLTSPPDAACKLSERADSNLPGPSHAATTTHLRNLQASPASLNLNGPTDDDSDFNCPPSHVAHWHCDANLKDREPEWTPISRSVGAMSRTGGSPASAASGGSVRRLWAGRGSSTGSLRPDGEATCAQAHPPAKPLFWWLKQPPLLGELARANCPCLTPIDALDVIGVGANSP